MKTRPGEKIKMLTVDELLGVPDGESAVEINIDKIYAFENHPFKVIKDAKMQELIESVLVNGIITPVIVRPDDEDGYEMISGHRRLFAAKEAGLDTIPAFIREMTDDQATIAMVDANLQRETILPSEKAFAYKMRYEAMKRTAGRPKKENASQIGTNLRADAELAKQVGESRNQVQRYMRLTELIPELLDYIDNNRIPVMTGVDISYLPQMIQEWIYEYIKENGTVKANQIAALRNVYDPGMEFTQKEMIGILNANLPTKQSPQKVTFAGSKLRQYFPPNYTMDDMERVILNLLAEWKQGQERKQHGI